MIKIAQDLDGCLADFDQGIRDITGKWPRELPTGKMWAAAARADQFFAKLKWMPDGKELWDFIAPYKPFILTGKPMGKWAEGQKKLWCGNELGWDVPVTVCFSSEKHTFCTPGMILIDDRGTLEEKWVKAGGIFVLHRSAKKSIEMLKETLTEEKTDG